MVLKLKAALKRAYVCLDGPLKDTTLYLTSASTLEFSYNGQRGRYIPQDNHLSLKWEASK